MPKSLALAGLALAALAAAPLAAQGRAVPPGHQPPAGLCRVWYEGLPPGRQPAPTRCDEAERRASRDRQARVIYGPRPVAVQGRRDDRRDVRRDDRRYERRDDRRDDRRDVRRDDRWERDGRSRAGDRDGRSRADAQNGRRGDDRRYGCTAVDRAGRCIGRRALLPPMLDVRSLQQGRRTSDMAYWLGGHGTLHPRVADRDRDGRPEEIWWIDARGRVVQHWIDDTRSGRADRVVLYENGRAVRVVG